jgi:hypothetical protein
MILNFINIRNLLCLMVISSFCTNWLTAAKEDVHMSNLQLCPYNKAEDESYLRHFMRQCYLVDREIENEELEDIGNAFNKKLTSVVDLMDFFATNTELMPGTVYMCKEKTTNQPVGFIISQHIVWDYADKMEICFFAVDNQYENQYPCVASMLQDMVSKADEQNISELVIFLQKGETEPLSYCKAFGFTFIQDEFMEDGLIGTFSIN